MTAKEYLSRIKKLEGLIKDKSKSLRKLKENLLLIPSTGTDEKVQTSTNPKAFYEVTVENIAELETEIINLNREKNEIIGKIYSLDNLLYVKVLSSKYINGLSLNDIADALSYSYEHIRRVHSKALNEICYKM